MVPVRSEISKLRCEASKLKVLFLGVDEAKLPRAYTLTHPQRPHLQAHPRQLPHHQPRSAAGLVQPAAEGRGGGRVEEGPRRDVPPRPLPHQWRPFPPRPRRRPALLHLLRGTPGGTEGVRSWRVRRLPGAGGGNGVGLLPLQPPRVQPGGVLGAAPARCLGREEQARGGTAAVSDGPAAAVRSLIHNICPTLNARK
ncbi:hypothetical protein GW17_00026210 [Ensete ventricosum]|nr:hypothetical protein GW17_00026210 [Ensete ventricosum]